MVLRPRFCVGGCVEFWEGVVFFVSQWWLVQVFERGVIVAEAFAIDDRDVAVLVARDFRREFPGAVVAFFALGPGGSGGVVE